MTATPTAIIASAIISSDRFMVISPCRAKRYVSFVSCKLPFSIAPWTSQLKYKKPVFQIQDCCSLSTLKNKAAKSGLHNSSILQTQFCGSFASPPAFRGIAPYLKPAYCPAKNSDIFSIFRPQFPRLLDCHAIAPKAAKPLRKS